VNGQQTGGWMAGQKTAQHKKNIRHLLLAAVKALKQFAAK